MDGEGGEKVEDGLERVTSAAELLTQGWQTVDLLTYVPTTTTSD